jgi:sugar phosphate isomerase/epimerase
VRRGLSAISTVGASFAEDVVAYGAAGFDAIGLWEFKLPDDDAANRALVAEHGLAVANCVPTVPSFLPLALPGMEGPLDPDERLEAICTSVRRLAAYEPECILCLSGPLGARSPEDGRTIVADGLRAVARAAAEAGVRVGFEPIHPSQHDTAGFVCSVADAMALLDEAGAADVGVMADTYNLAREDPADVAAIATRVTGLHVADEAVPPVPGVRVLPGEGTGPTRELVDTLRAAGWDGTLDVEIFSTPDAFWALPVAEAARRAHAAVSTLL